jgi:hypothetical protein
MGPVPAQAIISHALKILDRSGLIRNVHATRLKKLKLVRDRKVRLRVGDLGHRARK